MILLSAHLVELLLLLWISNAAATMTPLLSYQDGNACPDFTYACPECPLGQRCVYPHSGGCYQAGIPRCVSNDCHRVRCRVKALPCPSECQYSCHYNGPPCCPFLGEPFCEPCQTFVPCHVEPCPSECPDRCFYPNADYCCPKSGKPICYPSKDSSTIASA